MNSYIFSAPLYSPAGRENPKKKSVITAVASISVGIPPAQ